ncbi:MAG: hypothetical protein HKN92_00900 [Chitinophagales bacterium]|nr:hypothetical protein [Chitinophagales bacterium]
MKTLLNILWHIPPFLGFVSAGLAWLLGLLLTITIIAAPIGLGLMEYGKFLFWPYGNKMVSRDSLGEKQNPFWKAYSTLILILYLPLGIILAIIAAVQSVGLLFTIIGIPEGIVVIKSLGTYINPVNKKCVPSDNL